MKKIVREIVFIIKNWRFKNGFRKKIIGFFIFNYFINNLGIF